MVFRKPYAFLIKYFKVIHLILALINIYIAVNVSNMIEYFSKVFRKEVGTDIALSYINNGYYFLIGISLVAVFIIVWLLKYKKKPVKTYYIYVLCSIYVLVVMIFSFRTLNSIYYTNYSLKGLKAIRDFNNISLYIQYYLVVFMLIRGFGIDIKRFDFKSDINELKLESSDSEEVEISFENKGNEFDRRRRRSLREFRYYYLENKFIINIILIGFCFVFVGYYRAYKESSDILYKEGSSVISGKYNISVVSSYISRYNSNGNMLIDNDNSLVTVKFKINSTNKYKNILDTNFWYLNINKTDFTSNSKYSSYLNEIGYTYKNQNITDNSKYYILSYIVPNKYLNKKIKFVYNGSFEGGNKVIYSLNPINIGVNRNYGEYGIKDKVVFNKSILGNSYISIDKYDIIDSEEYNYCVLEDCSYSATIYGGNNKILKLNIKGSIDDSTNIDKDWSYIFNKYSKIYYIIDGVEYCSDIVYSKEYDEIPNTLYIEVDKNIENSSSYFIEFNIKGSTYKYKLK